MDEMTEDMQITPETSNENVIAILAEGNPGAVNVLCSLLMHNESTFRIIAIDLEDMKMRGNQIWVAFKDYCDGNIKDFIAACSSRDEEMIALINEECAPKVARAHGEQKTLPKVDGAIAEIMRAAEESGKLQRLDEGAEAINKLFIAMLVDMQARKQFTTNIKINLGLESGEWAKFAITLVELLDRNGNPYKAQPQDEQDHVPPPAENMDELDKLSNETNGEGVAE